MTKIAIVADTYLPKNNSAALLLQDLANEFYIQGIKVTVIVSDYDIKNSFEISQIDGIKVLRLKTKNNKNTNKYIRTLGEISMPIFMLINYKKCKLDECKWDAIIWYSPSIFLSPFILYLKIVNKCQTYLILRDIFPQWALDLKLLKKDLIYYFFKIFEFIQYKVANHIGIQSKENRKYFLNYSKNIINKIDVLYNWISNRESSKCSICVNKLPIKNRKIIIYAGNFGIAQDTLILIQLAKNLLLREDVGFLFIGRGNHFNNLCLIAKNINLTNTVFINEIPADELIDLYSQCHLGLITLDEQHTTHNIPGKFLSYIQSGLPVLAIVNSGNELANIIENYQVGFATTDRSEKNLLSITELLIDNKKYKKDNVKIHCNKLYNDMFMTKSASQKILQTLKL